jgi:hypothetical protein
MSPQTLVNIRNRASLQIEGAFQTAISIQGMEAGVTIPASRFHSQDAVTDELAGLLASYDAAYRVRRCVIPAGIEINPGRTTLVENGNSYRIEKVRDANGDPCLVLQCKTI